MDPYMNIDHSPKEITSHVHMACIWTDLRGLVVSLERNRATEAPAPRTEPSPHPSMEASFRFLPRRTTPPTTLPGSSQHGFKTHLKIGLAHRGCPAHSFSCWKHKHCQQGDVTPWIGEGDHL